MNQSSRTLNVKRNIIYGLLHVFVSILLPFIIRTIIIYRFGVEYLGLNSLFSSILGVLSLMEFGFSTAVVYSMYGPVSEGDFRKICAYLAYYRRIFRFVGFAILTGGIIILPFLSIFVRDSTLPGELNLHFCFIIFLANTVISYLLYGYMTAIPIAFQRRDILSRLDIFISLLNFFISILVLTISNNYYSYLLAMPIITIVRNLLIAYIVKIKYPQIKCMGEIKSEQKKDMKKKVAGIFVNRMTSISRNGIDSLCISTFIGLSMTGIYSNYYYILYSILTISSVICNSMIASVGNSVLVESKEKNYNDMRHFDFMYMQIATWATTCLLCLFQPFMAVWLDKNMLLNTPTVMLMCIYFYILKMGDIRWVYHEGLGLWWECRFIMIGETIINLVLNIVLCKYLGVTGIVLSTVLSVFITNGILCPKLVFKLYFKNDKLKEYWLDHFCYSVTMILTAGFSLLICELFIPMCMVDGKEIVRCIFCIGGRLMICFVLFLVVFWIVWHRSERYSFTISWIKRLKAV